MISTNQSPVSILLNQPIRAQYYLSTSLDSDSVPSSESVQTWSIVVTEQLTILHHIAPLHQSEISIVMYQPIRSENYLHPPGVTTQLTQVMTDLADITDVVSSETNLETSTEQRISLINLHLEHFIIVKNSITEHQTLSG